MTGGRTIKSLTPFLRLGSRSPEYAQGYRAATKACVTWLENVSEERGNKAALILRRAAVDMAREAKDIAFDGGSPADEGPFFDALRLMAGVAQGGVGVVGNVGQDVARPAQQGSGQDKRMIP